MFNTRTDYSEMSREQALAAVSEQGMRLLQFPNELRNDRDVVLAAI